jgi:hypothetical protein
MFDEICGRLRRQSGWKLHEIACGHDAMIDAPEDLTSLLLGAGVTG